MILSTCLALSDASLTQLIADYSGAVINLQDLHFGQHAVDLHVVYIYILLTRHLLVHITKGLIDLLQSVRGSRHVHLGHGHCHCRCYRLGTHCGRLLNVQQQ